MERGGKNTFPWHILGNVLQTIPFIASFQTCILHLLIQLLHLQDTCFYKWIMRYLT